MAARIIATTIPIIIAENMKRSPVLIFSGRFLLNMNAITTAEKTPIPIIKNANIHSLNCWLRIPSILRSSFGEISGFNWETKGRIYRNLDSKIANSSTVWIPLYLQAGPRPEPGFLPPHIQKELFFHRQCHGANTCYSPRANQRELTATTHGACKTPATRTSADFGKLQF
jgi:hypothetical protein